MKKQIFSRALLGFPLGIAIGFIISIIISIILGQGTYSPCIPELTKTMGSEINAVIFQTLLSGLLGSSFAASSLIWEIDKWSIAKQTSIYFIITAFVMMPIAYLTKWMDHSFVGFLIYFGIFTVAFVVVWLIQYLFLKNKIDKINSKVDGKQQVK